MVFVLSSVRNNSLEYMDRVVRVRAKQYGTNVFGAWPVAPRHLERISMRFMRLKV